MKVSMTQWLKRWMKEPMAQEPRSQEPMAQEFRSELGLKTPMASKTPKASFTAFSGWGGVVAMPSLRALVKDLKINIKKSVASLVVCCLLFGSLSLGALTLGSLTLGALTLSSCSPKNDPSKRGAEAQKAKAEQEKKEREEERQRKEEAEKNEAEKKEAEKAAADAAAAKKQSSFVANKGNATFGIPVAGVIGSIVGYIVSGMVNGYFRKKSGRMDYMLMRIRDYVGLNLGGLVIGDLCGGAYKRLRGGDFWSLDTLTGGWKMGGLWGAVIGDVVWDCLLKEDIIKTFKMRKG